MRRADVGKGREGFGDDDLCKRLWRVMSAGLASVRACRDNEGTGGIDQRVAPRIGAYQMAKGFDAVTQQRVAIAGRQQAVGERVVHGTGQIVTHAAGGAAGTLLEQFCQARGTVQPRGFEFGQRNPWRRRALGGVKFHRDLVGALDGALQQALIDVADLLHVQRPIRQRAPLELLDGFEQQQDGTVVDRQWLGDVGAPAGVF